MEPSAGVRHLRYVSNDEATRTSVATLTCWGCALTR
jgi:hypothetical protein